MRGALPALFQVRQKTKVKSSSSIPESNQVVVNDTYTPPSPDNIESIEGLTPELFSSLSSYDKGEKALAPESERIEVLHERIKRSREKVGMEISSSQSGVLHGSPPILMGPKGEVDDRLLNDGVGSAAKTYKKQVEFKQSVRRRSVGNCLPSIDTPVFKKPKRRSAKMDEHQDIDEMFQDDDEDEENSFMDDDGIDLVLGEDDTGPLLPISAHAKRMIMPNETTPDLATHQKVQTFKEMAAVGKEEKFFSATMRSIKGKESNVFVDVAPDEAVFSYVDKTMENEILQQQQIAKYIVNNNLSVPDLPIATKADIKEGLKSPDLSIGERHCVYGEKCTSYTMSREAISEDPDRYVGVEPFCCKEWFVGEAAKRIKETLASGYNLTDELPTDRVMCLMCHMSVVTQMYKQIDMGLNIMPVHILHSFKFIVNTPGEYPSDKMLMGDKTFKGIIGPFIRFVRDNYFWEPLRRADFDHKHPTLHLRRGVAKQRDPIQNWSERPCLDFC